MGGSVNSAQDREKLEEYQASVVQLKKQIQKLRRQSVKEREVLQIQTENMMLKLIEDLGEELGTPRFSKNFALQKGLCWCVGGVADLL